MKAARLIVLGVALAAGGVAAWLASGSRPPEPPKAEAPPPPLATVDVLVAKNDLTTGQVIGASDVGWQTWPAASAGAFIKKSERPDAAAQFVGAIVRSQVATGEPIRDSKVVMAKGNGFMAAILPHGMRAVSLDVAPDTGAGGFILPNDHVDVILTRRDKVAERATGIEQYVSEAILKNVRVLAIDQVLGEKDGQKVVIGKTATIELDPRQAETLALSRQLGSMSLALRSLLDSPPTRPEGGDEEAHRSIDTVRYGVTTQTAPH
jgi:pilus assembly protein CpaB